MSMGKRIGLSLAMAAVLGFAAFFLSGHALSWVLAAGIFYYEFAIRRADAPVAAPVRRGRK